MALLDFILDRTGAIGSKIRSRNLARKRDSIVSKERQRIANTSRTYDPKALEQLREEMISRSPPSPRRTTIVSAYGEVLVFDAATDIKHEFSSKVTSFPVEDRSTVTDHVVNSNPTFSVTGVFSDASVRTPNNNAPAHVKSLLEKLPKTDAQYGYPQEVVYSTLLSIRDDRLPITLVTPLDTYVDLIVTNISFPRSTGQGKALFVDITFEKIRRVSNELTTTFIGDSKPSEKPNKTSGDTAVATAEEKEVGSKPPVALTPAEKEKQLLAKDVPEAFGATALPFVAGKEKAGELVDRIKTEGGF